MDDGVPNDTFEKQSGVFDFRSSEAAAPNRRIADFGVLGTLRWAFGAPPVFRNRDEGVRRADLNEDDADVVPAAFRSDEDEVRNSSDDLLAEDIIGRGVRIGVSLEEEDARLSDDLLRRLWAFGVFRADILQFLPLFLYYKNDK